ncbi:MAG: hypothetical protein GY869_26740 [Planctomycetes bacterium]|nr:hypothetical protein [Planctomycetota bacterium]
MVEITPEKQEEIELTRQNLARYLASFKGSVQSAANMLDGIAGSMLIFDQGYDPDELENLKKDVLGRVEKELE